MFHTFRVLFIFILYYMIIVSLSKNMYMYMNLEPDGITHTFKK